MVELGAAVGRAREVLQRCLEWGKEANVIIVADQAVVPSLGGRVARRALGLRHGMEVAFKVLGICIDRLIRFQEALLKLAIGSEGVARVALMAAEQAEMRLVGKRGE